MNKHTIWMLLLAAGIAQADPEKTLLNTIYRDGGTTLYCQTEFEPGDRLKVDYIYSEKDLQRHFGCITSRQCSAKEEYVRVTSDLHNMYPIERKMELERRGAIYGDLPENVKFGECGAQLSFQTFDPPAHARGNIARAMLYMHEAYDLPLVGSLPMYQRWNEDDPPDDAERKRNSAIFMKTNRRNPFIDDPGRANRVGNL